MIKNKVTAGRPLKFKTVKELQSKIDAYFKKTKPVEITITGLALALDTSRETLCNYEKKEEYFDTIKKAKTRVEHEYEKALRKNGRSGDIFGLKNFGWKDKTDVDVKTDGQSLLLGNLSTEEIERRALALKEIENEGINKTSN